MKLKTTFEVCVFLYSILTFCLLFLFISRWQAAWIELIGNKYRWLSWSIPFLFGIACLFAVIIKKTLIGLQIALICLLCLEFFLFSKNFIYANSCSCSWLFPFLNINIHFWINSGMVFFCILLIISYIKTNKTEI
jgi:hypothetical protein